MKSLKLNSKYDTRELVSQPKYKGTVGVIEGEPKHIALVLSTMSRVWTYHAIILTDPIATNLERNKW